MALTTDCDEKDSCFLLLSAAFVLDLNATASNNKVRSGGQECPPYNNKVRSGGQECPPYTRARDNPPASPPSPCVPGFGGCTPASPAGFHRCAGYGRKTPPARPDPTFPVSYSRCEPRCL